MAWTRFKQGTREAFGKSEKYTEIPEDIEELHSVNSELITIYQELLNSGNIITQALKTKDPLEQVSKSWNKLSELKKINISSKNLDFMKQASDVAKLIDDYRIVQDAEVDENYFKLLRSVLNFSKEANEIYDSIKSKRLELDSKKYRLEHAKTTDNAKLAHFEDSVKRHSEAFANYCNQYRAVLKPLFDGDKFQSLLTSLIGSYLKALRSFYKRSLEKLEDFDRREDFTGKALFDKTQVIKAAQEGAEIAKKQSALVRTNSENSIERSSNVTPEPRKSVGYPPPAVTPPPLMSKPKPKAESVVALYDFNGVEAGDLSFKKNDVIEVIKKEGDWWEGRIGNRVGLFPSNYTKPE